MFIIASTAVARNGTCACICGERCGMRGDGAVVRGLFGDIGKNGGSDA